MGFSGPAHHYPGQDVSTIGIAHQHSAAQALFAGPRPGERVKHDLGELCQSLIWARIDVEVV